MLDNQPPALCYRRVRTRHLRSGAEGREKSLGRLPAGEGFRRGEEVFRQLGGVNDTFSTSTHYALAPLQLVESLVLAMTAESIDFLPPPPPTASPR